MNPIFDECFEFSVTLEQCLTEGAMICFTVMDHDVLTANDFGGEAFLALGNIPGVADYSTSVDNFHGLKQIELPLMQQKDKCEYPKWLFPRGGKAKREWKLLLCECEGREGEEETALFV